MALKLVTKMPMRVQQKFMNLVDDLKIQGQIQRLCPNFSSIGGGKYHCHLELKWVACWTCNKKDLLIEVYYAGSREDAPY